MKQEKTMNAKEFKTELLKRYPQLKICESSIDEAHVALVNCFKNGGKLLIAGNGGSAADSDHITGELTKSFFFKRYVSKDIEKKLTELYGEKGKELASNLEGGLPVIPLTGLIAANTAFSNDTDPKSAFAQLVNAIGKKGDVFLGITTSGNSENIIKALMVARAKGIATITLTGKTGGKSKDFADICICVPEDETFKVQELHLPVYHALCLMIEADLF